MKDNEIIKALECCTRNGTLDVYRKDCDICPLDDCNSENCVYITQTEALDLIKRQQAEIERLKSMNQAKLDMIHDLRAKIEALEMENEQLKSDIANALMNADHMEELYNNAIKEFAERVKYEFCPDCDYSTNEIRGTLNYLVKEMTEKGGV